MTDRTFRYLVVVGILNVLTLLLSKHQLEDGEIKSAYLDYVDQLKDAVMAEQTMQRKLREEQEALRRMEQRAEEQEARKA